MQELFELINSSSSEFNHVNVTTAFRKVQQLQHLRGVSQDSAAKALRILEDSALQKLEDFDGQGIASTLHTMAKLRGYKPKETLLLALEGRAEAISGEFSSQQVSNTMWGYATMGKTPGERGMRQLERRVEAISGEFNSQEVSIKLWAYAKMGTKPGELVMGLL